MRSATSPRFAIRILSNMIARCYSRIISGSPYSTGVASLIRICATRPAFGATYRIKRLHRLDQQKRLAGSDGVAEVTVVGTTGLVDVLMTLIDEVPIKSPW